MACTRGKIGPRECEICGSSETIEKHHADYDQPLDVLFVCRRHHLMITALFKTTNNTKK